MEKRKRHIAVIDLKAFYAYVECVDRGLDPWKAPLVVADVSRSVNTIILSVTPYLKSKGVPSRLRLKELPKGFNYIYATPRMERYIERSSEVIGVFLEFVSDEDIHVYSIDEAFIDLTSYLSYYQMDDISLVKKIIARITEKTGLQATAGIGDNFFQAKVALDVFAKKAPDWIGILRTEDVETKLWPITPLIDIWGIGPHTEQKLNNMGIFSMYDLAHTDKDLLYRKFGIMGLQLYDQAHGIDEADVHEEYVPKETSITLGHTLPRDYKRSEMELIIREMNDDLAAQLRGQEETTQVVSLMIGYSKSENGGFHHQMALDKPTNDTQYIHSAIMQIFNKHCKDLPIRNVSVNYAKLRPIKEFEQLDLFESPEESEGRKNLQRMIDQIHAKYGKNILLRMSSLKEGSLVIESHNQIGGHRK